MNNSAVCNSGYRPLYTRKLSQRYKNTQTATSIMCTRQQIVANRYYGHTQAAFSGTTSRYIMRCHVVFLLRSWCPSIPNSQWQAIPQETSTRRASRSKYQTAIPCRTEQLEPAHPWLWSQKPWAQRSLQLKLHARTDTMEKHKPFIQSHTRRHAHGGGISRHSTRMTTAEQAATRRAWQR